VREYSGQMLVNATVVLVLKQKMQELFVREEVQFGESFSFDIQKDFDRVLQVFKNAIILFKNGQMFLLLGGQLPQRKIFADLLDKFFPVTFSISVGFVLSSTLPVWIGENWLEVAQIIVMLLPF